MPQLPVISSFWNYLTAPTLPSTSLAISETHLALVNLARRGGAFEPKQLGVQRLPAGLVRARATEPNVTDEAAFLDQVRQTAEQAALKKISRLSVALPEGSARTMIITLDQEPTSRAELGQMLEWKISRNLNGKFSEMRVAHQKLGGVERSWLVSAVHEQVVGQYERLLKQLGWQAGAIIPQHLGEAQWLLRAEATEQEDQAMVSTNERGFVVVIVRGHEPLLVREVVCNAAEREDEFYRLMLFYRDRLNAGHPFTRLLVIGSADEQQSFWRTLSSALESSPAVVSPQQLGCKVEANAPFSRFAAAAGLATMAWN